MWQWVLAGLVVAAALVWRALLPSIRQANVVDWGGRKLNILDGLLRLFCLRFHRLRCDPMPLPEGGAIVVANHVSGLDPLLIVAASRRPLRFLIAREQYERFGLRWLFRLAGCIPVERSGQPELAFRTAMQALRRGEVVALFPEGGIHLPGLGPVKLKSGAIRLARIAGVPILPVHISGVRGAGLTLPAVVMRSRARLRMCEPIWCDQLSVDEAMVRMRQCIEGRVTL